jgi:hypothetical protein
MNTERTRIRPRMRGAEAASPRAMPPDEPAVQKTVSGDELPGLILLAQLPEVSTSSNLTLLAEQIDWLKKLDWKRVRQLKFDPNWVAGGVLALVLVLLLIITLNRTPKPATETAIQKEAPSWKDQQKTAPPTTLTATPNVATANPTGVAPGGIIPGGVTPNSAAAASSVAATGLVQGGIQQSPSSPSQPVVSSPITENPQGQFSLEGVYYPRTPYPAPVEGPIGQAENQAAGASVHGRELRTAHRDVSMPHHANAPQPGRAQLEGIISQP